MSQAPDAEPVEKINLHPRNKHRNRYDFELLIQTSPQLKKYLKLNTYHDSAFDFTNPSAVKALNQALLKQYYQLSNWDIPANYLCPPVPGRADYIHYLADLLVKTKTNMMPIGGQIRVLDIGVGANAIYPLIGQREYGWYFTGVDIDPKALANAQHILDTNYDLNTYITLRLQPSTTAIFKTVVNPNDRFDLTMCNPPFHDSKHAASAGTRRKWQNLGKNINHAQILNFGGQNTELFCEGGELGFIAHMIKESTQIKTQCLWFTTLVSKAANLTSIYRTLKQVNAVNVKTINMAQGQKKSRFVAWTFLSTSQQHAWLKQKV